MAVRKAKKAAGKRPAKKKASASGKKPAGQKAAKRRPGAKAARAKPNRPRAARGRAGTRTARAKPVPKMVKRDLRSLRKGLRKEITLTQKVSRKAVGHDRQLGLLRKEIEALKKKRKGNVSEYNRFMRQQIRKGLSFKQAASLWSRRKRQIAKKSKKRTAYNVFTSMQLKQGKTMKQAIRAWNLLKRPKRKRPARKRPKPVPRKPAKRRPAAKKGAVKRRPARKPARKVKKRPAKRPVKRKPAARRTTKAKRQLVSRKRFVSAKRAVVKSAVPAGKSSLLRAKRVVVKRQVPEAGPSEFAEGIARIVRSSSEKSIEAIRNAVSGVSQRELSDEALALRMLDVYYTEVARRGLKRRLTLDEVINSYFYCLLRVERKQVELKEIEDIVKKGIVRKDSLRVV